MKVEQVKKQYKDEWVLARVLKEDELNRPIDIKVIKHSKKRDAVYDELMNVQDGDFITTFYTGEILEQGQIFLL